MPIPGTAPGAVGGVSLGGYQSPRPLVTGGGAISPGSSYGGSFGGGASGGGGGGPFSAASLLASAAMASSTQGEMLQALRRDRGSFMDRVSELVSRSTPTAPDEEEDSEWDEQVSVCVCSWPEKGGAVALCLLLRQRLGKRDLDTL